MRLQKAIADSGYCSRRRAEDLIKAGYVKVNGLRAEIGQSVELEDEVLIDGRPLKAEKRLIYIALNKPAGYTCTNRSFRHEQNVFDLVKSPDRLFLVGRLDKMSRGLVILTNDGDYAQKMAHPRYEHEKEYEVTVNSQNIGRSPEALWAKEIQSELLKGVVDQGELLTAKQVVYLHNNRFRLVLTQGRKRQIRRMFQALGLRVSDLVRTRMGEVSLSGLKLGEYKEFRLKK